MKVAHVVVDGELAGGQLIARTLLDAVRERGGEGFIVSPHPGAFTSQAELDGITIALIDLSRLHRIAPAFALRRLLRSERVDLVHTHAMTASNVLSRVVARSAGIPVISHLHGPNVYRRQPILRSLYRSLDNATARMCRTIAVSEDTRARLVAQGFPADRVVTIYNGYDPPSPPPDSSLASVGLEGRRVLACVGRLERSKGQIDLIRAAVGLEDVVLMFVGRDVGGHRAELERIARDLAVEAVFTGPRTDVPGLLVGCTALVQASWIEAFPIAPLEAMGMRVPVIATAVGGTPELVNSGETGLLVPPGDHRSLNAALRRLLEDPALGTRLGEAGYERLRRRFSRARMVESVLALYEETLCPVQ